MTGLSTNKENSSLYVVGVTEDQRQKLLDLTGFALGSFPVQYLGLPLSSKKWTKMDHHKLCMKVTVK